MCAMRNYMKNSLRERSRTNPWALFRFALGCFLCYVNTSPSGGGHSEEDPGLAGEATSHLSLEHLGVLEEEGSEKTAWVSLLKVIFF